MPKPIVILGVFVADTAYRADRQPRMGETIMGRVQGQASPAGDAQGFKASSALVWPNGRCLTHDGGDSASI
jgi:ribokinase